MSVPSTPTAPNSFSTHFAVVLEVPKDIAELKEYLNKMKDIFKPVIIDKFRSLDTSARREATKLMNFIISRFQERWGLRWDDSFGRDTELNYCNCDESEFPEKVQTDMQKHTSMKEMQLVRMLNTDLHSMIAQRSYMTHFPDDFLPHDTPQNRMGNWMELQDQLKLRLSSDSLQAAHMKDLRDVIATTSSKWRRAFALAVGNIAHMRRLYFQITAASNTFVKRKLVIPSPGNLVKSGSNVSSESQTLLESELELLADRTTKAAEDLAKHCGIRPEGIAYRLPV